MPLRRSQPLTFTGRTLSDTVDGTAASRGALRSAINLLPHPSTRGAWVCRPGNVSLTQFAGFANPRDISLIEVVGDTVYGLLVTDRFPGFDEPFCYDLVNNVFLVVQGVTAGNVPASPPAAGDWTPPQAAQAGSRVVVTHPGFPGSTTGRPFDYGVKFGWFDVSSFSSGVEVDFVSGVPFLYGGPNLVLGVEPGMTVTGSGLIPAGTVVKNVYPVTQSANYFTGTSHSSDIIDSISLADMAEMQPGKAVTGPGVQLGSTILAVPSGASIQLSRPTTSSVAGGTFLVYGNIPGYYPYLNRGDFTAGSNAIINATTIDLHTGQLLAGPAIQPNTYVANISGTTVNMSQPATITVTAGADPVAASFSGSGSVVELSADPTGSDTGPLEIAGGTALLPLWGAGDTAVNFLPSAPADVAQFNGRAYFACGKDGVPFSDSLLPCVRTNGTQALTTNDGVPVTAIAPLMLSAPITGGIVASLVAFQRDEKMQQIQGDSSTGNLTMNPLNVATGTHAPNAVCTSAFGTFFISPAGLRLIDFNAKVSDPIGQDGDGIVLPFLTVDNPPLTGPAPAARMASAANARTLRIEVPLLDSTVASYWYDMTRRIWTGPHTGSAALVQEWSSTFIVTPTDGSAQLLRADDVQQPDSVYVEDGQPLQWAWETALMPDTGMMANNAIVQSAAMVALPPGQQIQVNFLNETRGILNGVAIAGFDIPPALYGQAIYGQTFLGPDSGVIRQRRVPWTAPIIFKQGSVNIRGVSDPGIIIGNFYMRYQILGYMLEEIAIPPLPPGSDALLADDGVTILLGNGPSLTYLTPG